ncbi:MAG: tRNA (adenosine(37)-N6)-threonylcarbamoyltransferase complex transferase subunit TsaD [Patescibacteria group bacterium]|jgi:N6-L-threonylcarbamoyladenine synthase
MNKENNLIILGIESSCDETAAALVQKRGSIFKILSSVVSSQIEIHKKYGGVVPEVAARNHILNIIPVIDQALVEAKVKPGQIDKIAVTTGPGLITSLLIGVETAKTLAYTWQKPICSINHLKAHLYANWLSNQPIKFPALALIVSGGHTELILMKNEKSLKKIGQTLDDAAGEAFDKVAQLLNIGYPGGPIISQLAKKGNTQAFNFARPMINSSDFNFSFSGLKTSVLYTIQKLRVQSSEFRAANSKLKADLCASFQQAAVDVLVAKTFKAAKYYQAKTVMLSGGVAANSLLRESLKLKAQSLKLNFLMPNINLCTDNAAMIAAAATFEKPTPWQKLRVDPNLEI